jgi:hypothetical protein
MDKSHLKCKFCDEYYDTDQRAPKMLYACGHSICSFCLRSFIEKRKSFFCVEDHAMISLTDAKFESFPPNIVLLNMLKDTQKRFSTMAQHMYPSNNSPDFHVTVKKRETAMHRELSEKRITHNDTDSIKSDHRTISRNRLKSPLGNERRTIEGIEKKSLTGRVESDNSIGLDNSTDNLYCETHDKRLEAVCEEPGCQMRVCLECGLFGAHMVG